MALLRINAEPKGELTEQILCQLRHRLPFAYLKPRTGRGRIDFVLDVSREKLNELRTWLNYCGWDAEISE